jgi:hypothetical protein
MDPSFRHRVERARKLTVEQRFYDTLELVDLGLESMRAGIRMQFPDADETKVREILRRRFDAVRAVEAAK